MSERLIRATVREIRVEYNGQETRGGVQGSGRRAKNILVAALAYPRAGTSVVTSLKEFDLESGRTFDDFGERPTFWDNGLFKEVVQGETALKLSVSDRDRHNPIVRFFDRALGRGLGALMRGRAGGMLGGLVGNLTKALSDAIAGSERRFRNLTVGTTDRAHLVVSEDGRLEVVNAGEGDDAAIRWQDGALRLTLRAPRAFSQAVLDRSGTTRVPAPKEVTVLEEGDANGYVLLDLEILPRVS